MMEFSLVYRRGKGRSIFIPSEKPVSGYAKGTFGGTEPLINLYFGNE